MHSSVSLVGFLVCGGLGIADLALVNLRLVGDVLHPHAPPSEVRPVSTASTAAPKQEKSASPASSHGEPPSDEPTARPPSAVAAVPAPVATSSAAPAVVATSPPSSSSPVDSALLFSTNSATIQDGDIAKLATVADAMRGDERLRAEIDGHCDRTGSDNDNVTLSTARARAVAAALTARGVSPSRLVVRGWGAGRPAAGGDDPNALAKNRRVEIHLRREVQP